MPEGIECVAPAVWCMVPVSCDMPGIFMPAIGAIVDLLDRCVDACLPLVLDPAVREAVLPEARFLELDVLEALAFFDFAAVVAFGCLIPGMPAMPGIGWRAVSC